MALYLPLPPMKRLLYFALLALLFVTCRKINISEDPSIKLSFSSDTVFFDTVFTSLGTATERVVVFNPTKEHINISDIYVAGGDQSAFRINVDGQSGNVHEDILLRPQDSIFIFVEATIDPNRADAPLIHSDSLVFSTNGNIQDVDLVAWGQDAYYYRPTDYIPGLPLFSRLSSYTNPPYYFNDTIEWFPDKPHVIYGYLMVDTSWTLKIHAGTQVHLHQFAGLWISPGSALRVEGEKDNEVVFQGDRLESFYDERPGQWDRIWINEGGTSFIEHAIIKNGFVGLQCEPWPFNEPLIYAQNPIIIRNSEIRNMVGIGLLARDHKVDAQNLLISSCGTYDLAVNGGGEYDFRHCTFANYWSGIRQEPLLFVNNVFANYLGEEQTRDLADLSFTNCIFYGSKDEEIDIEEPKDGDFNVHFDHCIIRTELDTTGTGWFSNCILNPINQSGLNPVFFNTGEDDYTLHSSSAAIDAGVVKAGNITNDLLLEMRDAKPDIGCYEYIP